MPSLAAPSPDPDKAEPFNDAIRHLIDSGGNDVGDGGNDIVAPTQLFTNNSNDAGNVATIREKRPASPRRTSAITALSSPAKKKSNTSSSPTRTPFTDVARVTNAAAAFGVGGTTDIASPPVILRSDPSPTSIADIAPPSSAPKSKRSSGPKMIGLVPKTQLLPWLRNPKTWGTTFEAKSDRKMKSEINSRRQAMLYHFTKAGKTTGAESDVDIEMDRPVT